MRLALAAAVLSVTVVAGRATSVVVGSVAPLPTRHSAKVRTFKTLLAITEKRPDVFDATHASVTVAGCLRRSYGFRCRGSLNPVYVDAIPVPTCHYTVLVFRRSDRLDSADC